ncbi:hypothetical protein ABFY59_15185 [Priestia aryabhattai]|uniref:hypothetical protein n=1 Tax=Priestia aryabhattai TaxID=412384 RepID=UPI0020D262B1|nr:hypothetical protein [Priestia aryabhattai]
MKKKGIISLLSVGLLASSLSVLTTQAAGNNYESSKKTIESRLKSDKTLNQNVINPHALREIKEQTLNLKVFLRKNLMHQVQVLRLVVVSQCMKVSPMMISK